jgi:hypothetical protein
MELEDVYKHASGAHRALAFPGFLGFLIGLGLEQYRQDMAPAKELAPDLESQDPEAGEGEALNLFARLRKAYMICSGILKMPWDRLPRRGPSAWYVPEKTQRRLTNANKGQSHQGGSVIANPDPGTKKDFSESAQDRDRRN